MAELIRRTLACPYPEEVSGIQRIPVAQGLIDYGSQLVDTSGNVHSETIDKSVGNAVYAVLALIFRSLV